MCYKFVFTNVKRLIGVLILFLVLVKDKLSHDVKNWDWFKNLNSAWLWVASRFGKFMKTYNVS